MDDLRPEVAPDVAQAPVRLGHHVLLHKLGAGGMGVVYAAYDERLDRRVAIKLLRKQGRTRASLRLKREAQALARLSHPNVVQIYEIGEFDEQPFLVMELIDGVTLNRWRAEQPRTRAEILEVFLAAGRGLAAAHAKGLIHRDFKPDNVMIRRDGQVVVMDFGLARGDERSDSQAWDELEQELEHEPAPTPSPSSSSELERALTEVGKVVGTVGYMAPEQMFGERVHARCDQFSFCATLWESLYNERPFRGRQVQEFARSVMSGPPKPPEPNEVPVWLRKVLERGLARNPDERWSSMNELLDALQRDPTRRRRAWLTAVGVLALGIATVAGVVVAEQRERERAEQERAKQIAACEREGQVITQDWNEEVATAIEQAFLATNNALASSAWQRTRPWLDDYARQWSSLRTQICVETTVDRTRSEDSRALAVDCLDEGRMHFVGLLEMLTGLGSKDASMVPAASATAPKLPLPSFCNNEALLQHRELTPEPLREELDELRLRLERARVRSNLGDHARAAVEVQAILDEAEKLAWRPLVVRAGATLGILQVRLGKYDEAKHAAQQAYWVAAGSRDELGMLISATELANAVGLLAQQEDAKGWALLAETLVGQLGLTGTIYEAHVRDTFAIIVRDMGDYEEALRHTKRMAEIYESVYGSEHPFLGTALMTLGNAYGEMGDHRVALEYKYRALPLLEAAQGSEDVEIGALLVNIGVSQEHLGNYEAALVSYQRGLANFERSLGVEHPLYAVALGNVGDMLCKRGECEEALALYRRALAIDESNYGPDHPSVGRTYWRIANILRALGSLDEALEHFRKALTILEAKQGLEHPRVLSLRLDMAAALHEQGHVETAIEQYRSALEQIERQGNLDKIYNLANGLVGYGLALFEHGDVAGAREQFERSLSLCEEQGRQGVEPANARFALARVLWASGEQERARELVAEAQDGYRSSGQFGARGLANVEAWLREHPYW